MDTLRALSSLGKVLILGGLLMFVFGLVRLLSPYSASASVGGYTANCGSDVAPKSVVTTINCNHGAHLALDLSLLAGGVALAAGTTLLFAPTAGAGTPETA